MRENMKTAVKPTTDDDSLEVLFGFDINEIPDRLKIRADEDMTKVASEVIDDVEMRRNSKVADKSTSTRDSPSPLLGFDTNKIQSRLIIRHDRRI